MGSYDTLDASVRLLKPDWRFVPDLTLSMLNVTDVRLPRPAADLAGVGDGEVLGGVMDTAAPLRPVQVGRAVNCLGASLALGLVRTLLDLKHLAAQGSPGLTLLVLVSTIALSAWLIYRIWQGRNWARIAYLVFTLIGTLPYLPLLAAEFRRSPAIGAISSIQLGLNVFALYLLFTAPGSWFKNRNSS